MRRRIGIATVTRFALTRVRFVRALKFAVLVRVFRRFTRIVMSSNQPGWILLMMLWHILLLLEVTEQVVRPRFVH